MNYIFGIFALILLWPIQAFSQSDSLRFLALGDSYTIGESVDESMRWPVQLADTLQKMEIPISHPKIIAQTGWTTEELEQAINEAELNPPYDLVSLLIGVNDQYRGNDPDDYPTNIRSLLEKAIALAGDRPDRVFVVSIPNYGVTPFAEDRDPNKIRQEIKQYNRVAQSTADSVNVSFINITPISEKTAVREELTADDNLHPSGKMYKL